jgi:hypothetical protein
VYTGLGRTGGKINFLLEHLRFHEVCNALPDRSLPGSSPCNILFNTLNWFNFPPDRWASDVPLFDDTLTIVKEFCTKLRFLTVHSPNKVEELLGVSPALVVEYGPNYGLVDGFGEHRLKLGFLDYVGFRNFTSLELESIYDDLSRQAASIVSDLVASPDIRSLRLSVSKEAIRRIYYERQKTDTYHGFLKMVC